MIRLAALLLLAAPLAAQPLPARADSLARAFLAETGAPSLVVGVSRGGVRTVAGYGQVDGAAPTAETRYEIASVTKTFTALALAQATVQQHVTFDTPVGALLPDSVRLAAPVTLEALATHRSGLPRLPAPFAPANLLDPYADYTARDLMRFVASVRPDTARAYAYSNAGMGLLAFALARRAGVSVDSLLASVTQPLGLAATSAGGPVAPPRTGAGSDIAPWTFTDPLAGAGALRSTAADLLTYAEAVARPEERAARLAPALRLAIAPRATVPGRFRLGLAWHLLPEAAGPVEVAFHSGATFGSVSFVGVMPDEDVSLVLLANTGAAPAMEALALGVLRALKAEHAAASAAPALPAEAAPAEAAPAEAP